MTSSAEPVSAALTPYRRIVRSEWAALAPEMPQPLTATELVQIRGLGDRLDMDEVREVYLPLSRLLSLYASAAKALGASTSSFLGEPDTTTPFVIGIAGSVAVGKSTIARLLRELLSRWSDTPRVDLVTTDGFLYPNAELDRRGLMTRKGFPESYDRRALLEFLTLVKSGAPEVQAPIYSHLRYDIVPDAHLTIRKPDVVIVEGLNVLQPPPGSHDSSIAELFDFSIYVDAEQDEIAQWYVDRFMALRNGAFASPASYFNKYAALSDGEAIQTALGFWNGINLPNLLENVLPTRHRATLVLTKGADHKVESVLLRKL
ncbi:type I pantothenate kinase [uncultured Microbacterium sp.]|uniref:type I pantothenate kinase n=1 Tax=uncultured Microbacterium sp. TaxID=191216 RepID=UPI0035C97743